MVKVHKFKLLIKENRSNLSKMATRIILTSDILLIPIRPAAQDYRTMQEFINRYNEAKEFRSKIPAYFVLNEFTRRQRSEYLS